MIAEIPVEQAREALETVADGALAQAGVAGPPVDAAALAKRLGMVVARDAQAGVRARFVRLAGVGERTPGTILLADDPRPERRQWAVAHEIGESLAHRVFDELGVDPCEAPPAAREEVANRLAGRLLLPRRWFAADGAAVAWDLLALKARYSTASHELIARRMLEMRPAVIISMFDQGRGVWRRSNRLPPAPPMAAAEQAAWKVAHSTGRAVQCEADELPEGIVDVRAWAIHETQWQREILRTEIEDGW